MSAHCLSDDEVLALLGGGLASETASSAEAHLDSCRRCRLLLSTLAARTGDEFHHGAASAFAVGDTVAGRYQVLALLGCGGMGEVYKVVDALLGETIALKTLSAGTALDERGIARLKTEVQVARRVTHRNVCRVFDVGFHDDGASIPFFTMELLGGETLRTRVRRAGPLPVAETRVLLEQLASGLDAAHAAGVVHRDFKSENVMLVPDDAGQRVVITDFGLARQHAAETLRQMPAYAREASLGGRTNDFIAGTLGYMAPEQLSGAPSGPATDIYALGVVLYEVLTGELPFSVAELTAAGVATGKPPPSLPATSGIPPEWQATIARCLETSPGARFSSAGDVLVALGGRAVTPPRTRRAGLPLAIVAGAAIAIAVAAVTAIGVRAVRDRSVPAARAALAEPPPAPPADHPALGSSPAHIAATDLPAGVPAPAPAAPAPVPVSRKLRRKPLVGQLSGAGGTLAVSTSPAPSDAVGKDDFIDPFGSP